ncbi:Protein fantom, partial [Rhizophlyctis rosea]
FLGRTDDLEHDKRLLQDLRLQYAECVQELEKTQKLLQLQEKINRDYKLEVEDLHRKLVAMRNEYELRLEEDSRLLDLRGCKIASLEAQLKSLAYGTIKGDFTLCCASPTALTYLTPPPPSLLVPETPKSNPAEEVELAKGQNLITLTTTGAILNEIGLKVLHTQGLTSDTETGNITTFVYFDFYDFETVVGPVGVGVRPRWEYEARFKVFVDDFFLMYLQSQPMVVNLCRSDGVEYVRIAGCTVVFKDLMDPKATDGMRYYGELISTHDNKTVIGQIDYTLRVHLPMSQAVQAYKERTVALNLLTVGDRDEVKDRFRSRVQVNNLIIRIGRCRGLKGIRGKEMRVYVAFGIYGGRDVISDTVVGSPDPDFNFVHEVPLAVTTDLDRYLRTSEMHLLILDEADSPITDGDYCYGVARIPLAALALGDCVRGDFDVVDSRGKLGGKVGVDLKWEREYRLDVVPVVSQLDHTEVAGEIRGRGKVEEVGVKRVRKRGGVQRSTTIHRRTESELPTTSQPTTAHREPSTHSLTTASIPANNVQPTIPTTTVSQRRPSLVSAPSEGMHERDDETGSEWSGSGSRSGSGSIVGTETGVGRGSGRIGKLGSSRDGVVSREGAKMGLEQVRKSTSLVAGNEGLALGGGTERKGSTKNIPAPQSHQASSSNLSQPITKLPLHQDIQQPQLPVKHSSTTSLKHATSADIPPPARAPSHEFGKSPSERSFVSAQDNLSPPVSETVLSRTGSKESEASGGKMSRVGSKDSVASDRRVSRVGSKESVASDGKMSRVGSKEFVASDRNLSRVASKESVGSRRSVEHVGKEGGKLETLSRRGSEDSLAVSEDLGSEEQEEWSGMRVDDAGGRHVAPQEQPNEDNVTMFIDSLHLNYDDPEVGERLKEVLQLFVSFRFLEYAPEELETRFVKVEREKEDYDFGFKISFSFNPQTHTRDRFALHRLLTSQNPTDTIIPFALVSEPPEDRAEE